MIELSAFGSVLRADFRPDSDVDLLVVFDKSLPVGLFHILRLQQRLAELLGRPVDLVPKAGLKPLIRDQVLAVDWSTIWQTAQQDVPALAGKISPILGRSSGT